MQCDHGTVLYHVGNKQHRVHKSLYANRYISELFQPKIVATIARLGQTIAAPFGKTGAERPKRSQLEVRDDNLSR